MDELTALPQNALLESRIEICRLLVALSKNRHSISADIGSHIFITHVLHVDLREEHVVVSFCANKALNNLVLESESLHFTGSYMDAHIAFDLDTPTEVNFQGEPAIQYPLPASVVLYHRRDCPRTKIPDNLSLRCIADEGGVMPFESRITDISHDGFGAIQYAGDINLEPGTLLKGCRIMLPGNGSVVADLELRYTLIAIRPDGSAAHRSGFRFLSKPDSIARLVGTFMQDLDKRA
ncbi:MAG: flagellar brake protein [Gammaproteobacteria bacterium]|nr:flagellar brake protein [Gammaproteobacteria bacterium]MBU1446786.1 flagellar brake protein [Gammaproteobacteria bacterium]